MRWMVIVLCCMLTGCLTYSDGDRVGIISKFSQKGMVCKTWEGELAGLGFKAGQPSTAGNVFAFTVEHEEIEHAIKAALDNGYEVRLTYRQEWVASPCRTAQGMEAPYFVTGVTVLR